jgi:hypothetical protein
MLERDYLILGHPRSGTGYMAKLFQANGHDVRHEEMGGAGTSNWQFAVKAEKYPFEVDEYRRQDVSFKSVCHVVRHPLHAINSIAFTEWGSDNFRAQYVPLCGNQFERAIMSYYGWNKLIHSQGPDMTFALEDAKRYLGFEVEVDQYNQRDHENISEYDMKRQCNAVIWEYYICMADFYNKLLNK